MAIRPKGIQTGDAQAHHQCLRKGAYTKRIAFRVARRARQRKGEPIQPYECRHCDSWHVGHEPGSRGGAIDG